LTLMEAELGRKSQGEWGLLSARLGSGAWQIGVCGSSTIMSTSASPIPSGWSPKASAGEDSYGGVLVGNMSVDKSWSAFMCVDFPYPRRLGHLAGTQWEWLGR
jgi:hypothetical protein